MDGPRDYHIKISQRETNIIWYCLYVQVQANLFTQQKYTHKHRKQIYGYKGEKNEG